MPIKIPPHSGQILRCDYSGFIIPEMVKTRPVVVISPKPRKSYGLCTVIPLSTTEPDRIEPHHLRIELPDTLVAGSKLQQVCWAKCDMVNTISYQRLDLYRIGREANGKRIYSYFRVDSDILALIRAEVRRCITGSH